MANQELYDKQYQLTPEVLQAVQTALVSNPTGNGVKRAKRLLRNKIVTYQAMKKMLHDFTTMNPAEYSLAGGDDMKAFIETHLNQDRAGVQRSKKARQGLQSGDVQDLKAFDVNRQHSDIMNEAKEKEEKKEKSKNAVAVIVNKDNKILLLKRGKGAPWMPNKWGLVGGGIEKGETPQKAVEREIEEETGLEIKKFVRSFSIERHADSIEHLFACRYNGDPTDIELDDENSNYGWYDVSEMEYLEIVPHLIEYITLVFKKYE